MIHHPFPLRRDESRCILPRENRRRGTALVEFALVVGILFILVMGVIDFAFYGQHNLRIANATREGARTAATGKTVAQIRSRVQQSCLPTVVPDSNIVLEVSRASTTTPVTWGAYAPLGDSGSTNNANADDYIRVTTIAANKPVTSLFGPLFKRNISSQVVMRRERTD